MSAKKAFSANLENNNAMSLPVNPTAAWRRSIIPWEDYAIESTGANKLVIRRTGNLENFSDEDVITIETRQIANIYQGTSVPRSLQTADTRGVRLYVQRRIVNYDAGHRPTADENFTIPASATTANSSLSLTVAYESPDGIAIEIRALLLLRDLLGTLYQGEADNEDRLRRLLATAITPAMLTVDGTRH